MSYEQLWAPWRLAYIKREHDAPSPDAAELLPGADFGCFLCRAAVEPPNVANLGIEIGAATLTVANRFPYNNGHLLVAPRRHVARLDEMTGEENLEAMRSISHWIAVLELRMNAEGFNVGLNLGRIAGAGLPGHLHWHIVPRWSGDTNFMPAVGAVNVIPQSLETLCEMLRDERRATS